MSYVTLEEVKDEFERVIKMCAEEYNLDLSEYELVVFDHASYKTMSNSKNNHPPLGCCYYRYKRIGVYGIHIENSSKEEVFDTIRHEIAHAAAFHFYGHIGHGRPFKEWAVRLGATPKSTSRLENEDYWIAQLKTHKYAVLYIDADANIEVVCVANRKLVRIERRGMEGHPEHVGNLWLCPAWAYLSGRSDIVMKEKFQ